MSYKNLKFPEDSLFLVTGAAGFIGSNLCEAILDLSDRAVLHRIAVILFQSEDVKRKMRLDIAEELTERELIDRIILKFIDNRLVHDTLPSNIRGKLGQRTLLHIRLCYGLESANHAHDDEHGNKRYKDKSRDNIFDFITFKDW